MQPFWRIELLGTLKANREGLVLTRFRTRRVASLLGYLAYYRNQMHPRDQVAAMLWPDADIDVSRRNLRQALSSLRHDLEPPSISPGSVVLSIHDGIELSSEHLTSDVAEFESLIQRGRKADQPERAFELLSQAVRLYKGELLPGFNEDWIWPERVRLEDLYLSALRKLAETEDPDASIDQLRSGVIREPLNEQWHIELIQRYIEVGDPEKALAQYADLERVLQESFEQLPSERAQALAEHARLAREHAGRTTVLRLEPHHNQPKVNLRTFSNRFFGRQAESQAICTALESGRSRLLTILGPAGVGKTRLSVECASWIAAHHSWNVWFVPLAERSHAADLYEAILASVDSKLGGSSDEIERIVELTEGRPTLFVLDNLEQIANEVGAYVSRLLEAAPNVCCLTSSRQALQVEAEHVVAIEPLPLPTSEWEALTELALVPSIQLFLDRCQTIRPDLQLNERNANAIVTLCSRLEGLPLAIEIAAGLSNSFSPAQMVHHLPLRLPGLTSRRRDVPARHRSLRSAIDWSYDLLPPELQSFFRQLCVFRGGFTVEAAANVASPQPPNHSRAREGLLSPQGSMSFEDCLAALQSLQERSLLRAQPEDDAREPRFSLLVAFREFAEELIDPEELHWVRSRHAAFFASRLPRERSFASVDEQTAQHMAIEFDYDNFVAAIEFSLEIGELATCVRLLGILAVRWLARGPKSAERKLIRKIAQRPDLIELDAERRVQVQRMLGTTHIRSGEYQAAYDACSEAVTIATEEGDAHLLATCYSGLSICAGYLGAYQECLHLNKRVLELAGEDLVLAERSYLGMGSVFGNLGRPDDAAQAFEKAREASEKLRGGEPDALIVINQARLALEGGRSEEALRFAHEAMRISRRLRDDFTLAMALTVVSRYYRTRGNYEAALATNLEALEKFRQGDFAYWILHCLRFQAMLWSDVGRTSDATTLLAASTEPSSSRASTLATEEQVALESLQRALSSEQFESAWAHGLGMSRTEAIRFAVTPILA